MDFHAAQRLAINNKEVKRIFVSDAILWEQINNLLPLDYQPIEYIYFSGNQYILYQQEYSNITEIDFIFSISEQQQMYMAGAYNLYASNQISYLNIFYDSLNTIGCFTGNNNNYQTFSSNINNNIIYNLSIEVNLHNSTQNQILKQNNNIISSSTETIRTPLPQYNLSSFGVGLNGHLASKEEYANKGLIGKIYRFKHKNDGIITRDFIPCYRKIDNEIGFFDIINNEFFINSGSGNFEKGPDILKNIIDEIGYMNDIRISSSNRNYPAAAGYVSTGLIDLSNITTYPVMIQTQGVDFTNENFYNYFVRISNSNKQIIQSVSLIYKIVDGTVSYEGLTITDDENGNIKIIIDSNAYKYFRLCGYGRGENLIITVNYADELIEEDIPLDQQPTT